MNLIKKVENFHPEEGLCCLGSSSRFLVMGGLIDICTIVCEIIYPTLKKTIFRKNVDKLNIYW